MIPKTVVKSVLDQSVWAKKSTWVEHLLSTLYQSGGAILYCTCPASPVSNTSVRQMWMVNDAAGRPRTQGGGPWCSVTHCVMARAWKWNAFKARAQVTLQDLSDLGSEVQPIYLEGRGDRSLQIVSPKYSVKHQAWPVAQRALGALSFPFGHPPPVDKPSGHRLQKVD